MFTLTCRELFEQLDNAGLADAPLIYPNYIYQQAAKHPAHVIGWNVKNGEVSLQINIKEGLK
jgi:hypothetical protein